MTVKSTYNFVPAPNHGDVYEATWAHQVSHDIPFSDGESGEITLNITAETPIFIRNGHSKPKDGEKPTAEFSNIDIAGKKTYFIPATSLKGMIRNVLEIMSFSKMNKALVNDDRYAFRDLTRNSLYMNSYKSANVQGGWLKELSDGSWVIEECEEIALINHEDIDSLLKTNFRSTFLNRTPKDKSAKAKYEVCSSKSLRNNFDIAEGDFNRLYAKPNINGRTGTIVFTGQSSQRKEIPGEKSRGKVNEFVFFDSQNPNKIAISEKQQKDFKFIYLDHDLNNISTDWKFWKEKRKEKVPIPVFFTKNGINEVKHFGLAFMYKLPFEHSIHQLKPINTYTPKRDLAETIFGYVEKKESLKGRIMISHAFATKAETLSIQKEILSGPKASYFPFYLEQFKNNNNEYNTYQDQATLRGFKRYPVQSGIPETFANQRYDQELIKKDKVFSHFIPLNQGSEFACKIRFHNLTKIEIGALISATTFHGYEENHFHSLGGAKPFGYGKVRITLDKIKPLANSKEEYMLAFEKAMGENWINKPQITQLFSMARNNTKLEYPKIEEFVEYKKDSTRRLKLDQHPSDDLTILSFSDKKEQDIRRIKKEEKLKETGLELNCASIIELASKVKDVLEVFDKISITDKAEIILEIKRLYKADTNSRRKLKKDYETSHYWQNDIKKWIGETEAKTLHSELNNK